MYNTHDHCIICFESTDLQKCTHCTALYCKDCCNTVVSTYNNCCVVCKQSFKEGLVLKKNKIFPTIDELTERIEHLEQNRNWWTFERIVVTATILVCGSISIIGLVFALA